MAGEGGGYQPGVLTIACEGARALFLSHQQGEIIQPLRELFRLSHASGRAAASAPRLR